MFIHVLIANKNEVTYEWTTDLVVSEISIRLPIELHNAKLLTTSATKIRQIGLSKNTLATDLMNHGYLRSTPSDE